MIKRKKYLIDKGFQLKTALFVLGVVASISLIILGSISASIVYNNEKINNIYKIEDNIFQLMQTINISSESDENYKVMINSLTKSHENNLTNIEKISNFNKYLLILLVMCIIAQGIILFILIIRMTHRIIGPIYVISNYMKELISGMWPEYRPLREKDELKQFYQLFIKMADSFRERCR